LKRLGEQRKDIVLTDRATKLLERLDTDETTKDLSWNGREIRNGMFQSISASAFPLNCHSQEIRTMLNSKALQTAIALATFEAEQGSEETGVKPAKIFVRDDHFQTVIDRRKEFIEYRKSIRNQDEDARAYQEGSRAPPLKKH